MEEILSQFSLMNTNDQLASCSKHEQLHMFNEEIQNLLRNGCSDYQYIKFNNFNELIRSDVNLNDDIYPEHLSSLLFHIRSCLSETESGDIFKRLLSSFKLYGSILCLLKILEDIEVKETYNYYIPATTKQPNDGFWDEW